MGLTESDLREQRGRECERSLGLNILLNLIGCIQRLVGLRSPVADIPNLVECESRRPHVVESLDDCKKLGQVADVFDIDGAAVDIAAGEPYRLEQCIEADPK